MAGGNDPNPLATPAAILKMAPPVDRFGSLRLLKKSKNSVSRRETLPNFFLPSYRGALKESFLKNNFCFICRQSAFHCYRFHSLSNGKAVNGLYLVLPSFTEFYRVSRPHLHRNGVSSRLVGSLNVLGFQQGLYLVLPSFFFVLLGAHLGLPSFT